MGALVFGACVLTLLTLNIVMVSRVQGHVRDLHAGVSFYANLPATRITGGLFLDGHAANGTLMLFLFKCLTICRPQNVLELGSGQTTKLFADYFHEHPDAYVCSLEHNEDWIQLVKPQISRNGRCHDYRHAPLIDRDFIVTGTQEHVHTKAYTLPPDVGQHQFNLILVDGPDTGPGSAYTRHGFLEHVPRLLAESFVVIFDDAERWDELRLVSSFQRVLRTKSISHVRFDIAGVKTQTVFCSKNLAFLCSI